MQCGEVNIKFVRLVSLRKLAWKEVALRSIDVGPRKLGNQLNMAKHKTKNTCKDSIQLGKSLSIDLNT